ncbi:MAG: YceI family protein [Candidatus Limnocylindria bacterium]
MTTWYIDPSHSAVTFRVKHMMISTVRGKFGAVRGTVEFDPEQPASAKVFAAIDARTIDTNDARRDGHLASADFFDTQKHPEIVFKSTAVEPRGHDTFSVTGDLTIRGTTYPVSFDATLHGITDDIQGGKRLGAAGTLTIERSRWGLVWNQPIANGVLVSDTVNVDLDLAAVDEATGRKHGLLAEAA